MLRLSQQSLALLETCPRRFQHGVLEGLVSPPPLEQQRSLDWGDRFHRLMEQYSLQLPVAPLLAEDDRLQQSFQALQDQLQTAQPDWARAIEQSQQVEGRLARRGGAGDGDIQWESEHQRNGTILSYPITVIYDLLLVSPTQAQILDWKTYPQPEDVRVLAQHWQTRLYCYLLVETSDYRPEQVSMTYWFIPKTQTQLPSFQRLPYSLVEHQTTTQTLTQLLQPLEAWLADYRHQGRDFPQLPLGSAVCEGCPFNERCQRVPSPERRLDIDAMLKLEAIEEVPLRS